MNIEECKCNVYEWMMKNEGWILKDEWWIMNVAC